MDKSPLYTRDLAKRYGNVVVTDQVNLALETNELHCLIGPNGAGKTSLLSQLAGDIPSDSGSIFLFDEDITRLANYERVRRKMVRSFQITSLFVNLSAVDNVTVALRASSGHAFQFFADRRKDGQTRQRALEFLENLGLAAAADILVRDLNYGEQRQLEIAMALAASPLVLLLDEPMAGLSRQETADMVALLRKLKYNYTILLVEHDMHAVFALADRISVLVNGRIIVTGTPDEIREDPEVRQAYLGDDKAGSIASHGGISG